jgi:hypothetical protein
MRPAIQIVGLRKRQTNDENKVRYDTKGTIKNLKPFKNYLFAQGGSQTPHPFFLPTSFLYVNLVAREHGMSFRTLSPRLTVLDIPYFADAYSRTMHPIDLHNF